MTLDMGRATTGASIPMPRKMATAPTPTSWMAGRVSPETRPAMPNTATTDPITIRRRDDSAWSARWSARAATGGIRTAWRAGPMADTTVTPTPTSRRGDDRAGGEDQGTGGQGDAEPLQEGLEAQRGQHAEAEADQ